MSHQIVEIDILRYRPELDDTPFTQTFEIPYQADMSILEALQYIKDHLFLINKTGFSQEWRRYTIRWI